MSAYSLVIPVYRNADSIARLLQACEELSAQLDQVLEVVFVVDGSPDDSYQRLAEALPSARFRSQLVLLSRNFGSFSAIREGLRAANGQFLSVMAADLQEPPELVLSFFQVLSQEPVDLVLGTRTARADPLLSRAASSLFWWVYRRVIEPAMPRGGVDVFGCNRAFRDRLLALPESNSSLVGLLFWLGYRRKLIPYARQPRREGQSGWTIKKKVKYLFDSLFAFSDLPIRLLAFFGALGLITSSILSIVVVVARVLGVVTVPGYAATVLVVAFFAALNSFGLGVIGSYVWRTFENTKGRPLAIVMAAQQFNGRASALLDKVS
ncbi:MAG TPA: glycosyltransferase family 2 protein [Polyangiaceae bacterium]|nr:glycosyltransferase family 2 protein [Polyangiaceae bacterium]